LEPQNKIFLNNFLDYFNGSRIVPREVGASLKHWAIKTLDEVSESATRKLPYLKTTQNLTSKGEVDDPKALDRLEVRVNEFLEKLEDEGPFYTPVQSLGYTAHYSGMLLAGFTTPSKLLSGEDIADEIVMQMWNEVRFHGVF
jgi:hypothetical protein